MNLKSISILLVTVVAFQIKAISQDCNCDITIPPSSNTFYFDGNNYNLQGGEVICLEAGYRRSVVFSNLVGAENNYITIKNCGGQVELGGSNVDNAILFVASRYFRLTGSGDPNVQYGIYINSTRNGSQGIAAVGLSSDMEMDHIEIKDAGYTGIMIKSDPSCSNDDALRPNFTMYNISLHDLYIHEPLGEGIYLGNSFYKGTTIYCGYQQYTHEIRGVRVYDNLFENTGREAFQIGGAVADCEAYNNRVYNYGTLNAGSQNGGIQFGTGTTGKLYNNFIKGGTGPAIVMQGIGENYVYNNIVINSQYVAININTRPTPLSTDIVPNGFLGGVYVINNTFINSQVAAIDEYINEAPNNVFYNNLIVTPVAAWRQIRTDTDWDFKNNLVYYDINEVGFIDYNNDNYGLLPSSPAVDAGLDVGSYDIFIDYDSFPRPAGNKYDVGAYELASQNPVVNAGSDRTITLPINTVTLSGSATDSDGSIASYLWEKISGPTASLVNNTTSELTANNLLEGVYEFRLTATDNDGNTGSDDVQVTVLPEAVNSPPTANAGPDLEITLPTNIVNISGSGSDSDGNIAAYLWTKISGPSATISDNTKANIQISNLVEGTYIYEFKVTDDDGAEATDQVTITVNPEATNIAPTANAGPDQEIYLPNNSTNISGSGTDPDGNISSYSWTKVSGPSGDVLQGQNTSQLTISNLVEGIYVYKLTVTDNDGASDSDNITVTVTQSNQAPIANAGNDITIKLPSNSVTINGTGIDNDGTITSYSWQKTSGPNASLSNTNNPSLIVSNMVEGVYVFRLTVTDNESATGSDEVRVTVTAANLNPVANAGNDQTIYLPLDTLKINGSGSDNDGTISSFQWVKVSGPSINIVNSNSAIFKAINVVSGTYRFRLTVTDNEGATDSDIVDIYILPEPVNNPPTVNAGNDIYLTLPNNSTVVQATGNDPDGDNINFVWQKVSGPNSGTFDGLNTPNLTLSNLVEGNYTFRVTATDTQGASGSDFVTIFVSAANVPPTVSLGNDITLDLPVNSTTLNANAQDPDGSISNYSWQKISGPPDISFSNTNQPTVEVSNFVEGIYVVRVTVEDNSGENAFDEIKITVQAENKAPVVNAGPDKTINLPFNTVTLTGSASDQDSGIGTISWSKISGGNATLNSVNTLNLTATDLEAGSYIFRLTVTDNEGLSSFDDVNVTVVPETENKKPFANAGLDRVINLPNNSISIQGSAVDQDGTIESYLWNKVSGPSVTISNSNTSLLNLQNLVQGIYIFRLTVFDNDGANDSDEILITVLPEDINQNPSVSAGNDITIVLPIKSTVINAVSNDPDGEIVLFEWTKQIGPDATLNGVNTRNLFINDLVEGNYTFRITVEDNDGAISFDEVNVFVLPEGSNLPPTVNAGEDQNIFLPTSTTTLSGSASDSDGQIDSVKWEKISGPTFSSVDLKKYTVLINDLKSGIYKFRFTAYDNSGESSFDEVSINVQPETVNRTPIVDAGPNISIVEPVSSVVIEGFAYDPDGQIVSYQWTKNSGPDASISGQDTRVLSADNLVVGEYLFTFQAEDNEGATGSDDVRLSVLPEGSSLPPIAQAGTDITLYLPEDSVTINGNGFDPNDEQLTYQWTKTSGPSVQISGSDTKDLNLDQLIEGTYKFKLVVRNTSGLTGEDDVLITVLPSTVNISPEVSLGDDIYVRFPQNSTTLNAEISFISGDLSTIQWEKISGPSATWANENSLSIDITDLVIGRYTFRINIEDSEGLSASDEVDIIVLPEGSNLPPVTSAGKDQFLLLPQNSISITGIAYDSDGSINHLVWEKVEGPNAELININSTTLSINELEEGNYVFRLTATDNEGLSTSDEMSLSVTAFNASPIAYAGNDTVIAMPINFVLLTASGEDTDGFITDFIWEQVSGPDTELITEEYPNLRLADLEIGKYTFRLTVVDNKGDTGNDEVEVNVIPSDEINKDLLGIHTVFSPDGNGIDDVWFIDNLNLIEGCNILIFNRFGQKVYETNNYNNDWDGTSNGTPLPEGDYYYIINCGDNSKRITGGIRIIKSN